MTWLWAPWNVLYISMYEASKRRIYRWQLERLRAEARVTEVRPGDGWLWIYFMGERWFLGGGGGLWGGARSQSEGRLSVASTPRSEIDFPTPSWMMAAGPMHRGHRGDPTRPGRRPPDAVSSSLNQ